MKIAKLIAFILILFTVTAFAKTQASAEAIKIHGSMLAPAQEIANFQLTSSTGQPFTKEDLKGHWTMMYFGFTNCSMICPSSLAALNDMYQQLQNKLPANKMPKVVFVTIDPERDTQAKLHTYITAYNPNFIGLRGNAAETADIEKKLNIEAEKLIIRHAEHSYSFQHTAEVLLFNPEGKLQAYLAYPHEGKEMAKDYQVILKETSNSKIVARTKEQSDVSAEPSLRSPGLASAFANSSAEARRAKVEATADKSLSPGYDS